MSRFISSPIAVSLLAGTLLLAGCDRGNRTADASGLTSSSGDVTVASYESLEGALNGEVTSEQYRKWLAAKQALDRVPNLPPPVKAQGGQPSQEDIDRAVQRLESSARAKAAIEGAGMSVREYVLTTLALDRAMQATSASRSASAAPPLADTGMVAATPMPQPYPPPATYAEPASPPPAAYPQPPADPLPGASEPQPPAYTPMPAPSRRTSRRAPVDSLPPATRTPTAPTTTPSPTPAPTPAPTPSPVPDSTAAPAPSAPPPAGPPPARPDTGATH